MTADQFKAAYPEHAHLEGNELWNMMEDKAMITQEGDRILLKSRPFWKRYRLRWLFYRNPKPYMSCFGPQYTHSERCRACKNGVNARIVWITLGGSDVDKPKNRCPKCNEEYFKEKNTGLDHKTWLLWMKLCSAFWWLMDAIHIVRNPNKGLAGRYDMFSDESRYVAYISYNNETGMTKTVLRSRKWYEYIFIKK